MIQGLADLVGSLGVPGPNLPSPSFLSWENIANGGLFYLEPEIGTESIEDMSCITNRQI